MLPSAAGEWASESIDQLARRVAGEPRVVLVEIEAIDLAVDLERDAGGGRGRR